MSTLTVATVKSNSSSPPAFQNTSGTEIGTLCRVWVNFNGTGTVAIRAQFNVSSITDNGAGDYTMNFATAMADINYSAQCSGTRDNVGDYHFGNSVWVVSASACRIKTYGVGTTSSVDHSEITVSIFR